MAAPDPRLTPARPDLAAAHLRGVVAAGRYAEPRAFAVAAATAPLTGRPDAEAPLDSTLLRGEGFAVYEIARGWAWGQAAGDGYVGYVPAACLTEGTPAPTHQVAALFAPVYPEPAIKTRAIDLLPFRAAVRAGPAAAGFLALPEGGFVCAQHLAPHDAVEPDWVATALRFMGAPYVWGGRTAGGLDCSALVQLARQAAGRACPRDSDMQRAAPGRDVAGGSERRGDLVFWRGHVGIVLPGRRLLHANAYAMAVAIEPLAAAETRIEAAGGGPVLARRRWPR